MDLHVCEARTRNWRARIARLDVTKHLDLRLLLVDERRQHPILGTEVAEHRLV